MAGEVTTARISNLTVRQFYATSSASFERDPTFVDPWPRFERFHHYIDAIGEHDAVIDDAMRAQRQQQLRWMTKILRASTPRGSLQRYRGARGLEADALQDGLRLCGSSTPISRQ